MLPLTLCIFKKGDLVLVLNVENWKLIVKRGKDVVGGDPVILCVNVLVQ